MGWNGDFLQQAVDTCTNPSGLIQDCPLFDIQSEQDQTACGLQKLPQKLVKEVVTGVVGDSLPGGVQIQYGPGPATQVHPSPPTTTVNVPSVGYSPGTTGTSSGSVLPGQVFKETANNVAPSATPAAATTPDAAPTVATPASEPSASQPKATLIAGIVAPDNSVAPSPSTAPEPTTAPAPTLQDDGLPIVSTQYITNGNVVSEVVWKEAVVYVTESQDVTVTVTVHEPTSSVQAVRKLRRGHGHDHFHRHLRHGGRR